METHLYFGGTGSGKTTYIVKRYMGKQFEELHDVIPFTQTSPGNQITYRLAGRYYDVPNLERGTDFLKGNYDHTDILLWLRANADFGKVICIADGYKIYNKRFLEDVQLNGFLHPRAFLITCSLDRAMRQLVRRGQRPNLEKVARKHVRAREMYQYALSIGIPGKEI